MAAVYEVNDFRNGLKIQMDGIPYEVTYFQHVKPGKGNAFTRTKLRNLLTGSQLEKTFKSGEKFEVPDLEFREMQFLYKDDNGYHFMDTTNYEQIQLNREQIGDVALYLHENLTGQVNFFNGKAISLEIPNHVNLKITHCEPGIKGDTVSGSTKPATLESGAVVQVPLHVKEGDTVRVDTRTGKYIEKVNK